MKPSILTASAALLVCNHAFAQETKITIHPLYKGTLTVPSIQEQKQELEKYAGSVSFVDSEDYQKSYAHTLRDVLKDTPGVYVQVRYGQEMRVSIRGSGIARGFHGRGLEILQDGITTNLADGSGDYYQIDPLALRSTEIYKGGNALAYGASNLGGAMNFITPTAATAASPNILRAEGGSFETKRVSGQVSREYGKGDFLANLTGTHAEGYRDHSRTRSASFNANTGYRFSDDAETRFYVGSYTVFQKLPGALTLGQALNTPTIANPAALAGDQARDTRTQRIANRTSFKLDSGRLDVESWFIHKNLFHPIFQVIDQDGFTYGIAPRLVQNLIVAGKKNELITGLRYFAGSNEALQFQNIAGSRGAQTLNARQKASNYEAYAENRFRALDEVVLVAGAKLFHSVRDYTDKGGLALNPTPKRDRKDYKGVNPRLGVLWEPQKEMQLFANITRSQDVPDFTDLAQTIGATSQFVPLKKQDAWTAEIGTRGNRGRWGWDATAFRSEIDDELLQFTTGVGIPASTFNAGRTRHQGLEFGASYDVSERVTLKGLWNYSDFRFVDDAQYGDNHIAGVPNNVLRGEMAYKQKNGFYLTPSIDWVPQGAYADQANTLKTPGYTLFGVQTGVQMDDGVLLYVDARNLANRKYVSDISTITDARVVGTSIFYSGEGRAVYGGVKLAF